MKFRALAVLSLLSLAPGVHPQAQETAMEPQFPQQQSAGDLLRSCAASRLSGAGRERRRYCAGFVSGVEEAVRMLQRSGQTGLRLCTPADVTASALAHVYVKYGANHKGELPDPAADVALHALTDAYPCPVIPDPSTAPHE